MLLGAAADEPARALASPTGRWTSALAEPCVQCKAEEEAGEEQGGEEQGEGGCCVLGFSSSLPTTSAASEKRPVRCSRSSAGGGNWRWRVGGRWL